jgi:hypothetical protein
MELLVSKVFAGYDLIEPFYQALVCFCQNSSQSLGVKRRLLAFGFSSCYLLGVYEPRSQDFHKAWNIRGESDGIN